MEDDENNNAQHKAIYDRNRDGPHSTGAQTDSKSRGQRIRGNGSLVDSNIQIRKD